MKNSNQIKLKIEGMSCGMCTGKVGKTLQGISGVSEVSVDLAKKEAIIIGAVNLAECIQAIEKLGFKVEND